MSKGWIKLHRQVMDHPFYEEERVFSKYEAWEYLLLNANHSDNKALIDGKMVLIERGSFITSIRKLQERWKWSNTKAISFLELLELEKMITKKSDTKKTLITVVMYDFYQGESEEKRHENDTKTTQKHTNNNVNNDKEKDLSHFEEFWKLYPSKKGKAKAQAKWVMLSPKMDFAKVIEGTKAYIAFIEYGKANGKNREYKDGATFVNQESWNDEWSIQSVNTFKQTNKQQPNLQLLQMTDEERKEYRNDYNKILERNGVSPAVNI
jgi:hypothetical protein